MLRETVSETSQWILVMIESNPKIVNSVRSLCLILLSELNPTKFNRMWCTYVWIYVSKLCSFEANWKFSTCSSQEVAYWMVYIKTSWKKKNQMLNPSEETIWQPPAMCWLIFMSLQNPKKHAKAQNAKLTSYIIFKISHAKTEVKRKRKVF